MYTGFEEATTMEMVDDALRKAEADAEYLQSRMNNKLNDIIEVHELAGEGGTISAG